MPTTKSQTDLEHAAAAPGGSPPVLLRVSTVRWYSKLRDDTGCEIGPVNVPQGATPIGPGYWWHDWIVTCTHQGRDYRAATSYIDKGAGPFTSARIGAVFGRLEQNVLGQIEMDGYRDRAR